MTRPIVTTFVCPPIPFRHADWSARFADDEPDVDHQPTQGWGATEAAAIADLMELTSDDDEPS